MILEEECIGCMFNQIYKALRLLKPDIPKAIVINTQKKLMEFFVETDILHEPGPLIGKKTYELIGEALKDPDPYKKLKEKSNQLALKYYDAVKKIIDKSEDPVFEAIAVSALGNTLDYGAHHNMDLINDIENFSMDDLVINDIPQFKESLEMTDNLLILGDNAGEIVFDKLLIETLHKIYPNLNIVFSVRAEPIINDATMEDAEAIGLTEIVKVIESPGTPGVELSIANNEFKSYFCAQDGGIILSKGQGNFESLLGMDVPKKEVFYILKAKCILMERLFKVENGALIFKKKSKGF
ncbi:MAG: damage-control phosphatase ARMT1 family protein [Promethearchaeota archaeon]